MNLLLIEPDDLTASDRALISGRRLQHLIEVHRVELGKQLRAGLINGNMGVATVEKISSESIELSLDLDQPPPPPLPLTLILALPRPKMMRRVLQTIATMGVKQLYLINSYRVEKSFWQSPYLKPESIRDQLILGLEQGRDTLLPEVHQRQLFKPFVEDELPTVVGDSYALVAHPKTDRACPVDLDRACTLAIGPEGGFIPYEIEKLEACGFEAGSIGPRILRVETAIPALLSRLYPLS